VPGLGRRRGARQPGARGAGLGPIGLLNPHLYPLQGRARFNDITSGTNGAYRAGPGYDLCTGLGSPNVANLIAALSGPNPQRLSNISTRASGGTGANIMIAGFVISGAGTAKSILVRGVGPALTRPSASRARSRSPSSASTTPTLHVLIASDTGWGNAPVAGTSAVAASFRQATAADMSSAGAFALPPRSADSAMVLTLPAGNYTVRFRGCGRTRGWRSRRCTSSNVDPQVLTNISARCFVGRAPASRSPGS
jgi:hypothetical protein